MYDLNLTEPQNRAQPDRTGGLLRQTPRMALKIGLHRVPFALRFANFLYRYFKPEYIIHGTIEVKGLKMYIDQNGLGCGTILLFKGSHEEFVTMIFERLICRGDIVVDVGAGIGYYTLLELDWWVWME